MRAGGRSGPTGLGRGGSRRTAGGRCYTPVHLSARSWRPVRIVTPTAAGVAGRCGRAPAARPGGDARADPAAAWRAGPAANYRIRAVPRVRLRVRPGHVRVVVADPRRSTAPAGFYAQRRLRRLPARLPARAVARSGSSRTRSAAATRRGSRPALIKLPPMLMDIAVGYVLYRLVLGWTWPGRRAETAGAGCRSAVRLQPGHVLRLGAVGPDGRRGRARAAAGRRGARPRQQRGGRGAGRAGGARQAAVRGGARSRWWASCCCGATCSALGSGPRHAPVGPGAPRAAGWRASRGRCGW